MFKKLILTLLITATILGNSLSVSAENVQSFEDVNTNDWYYDSVMAMTEKGYFAGKGDVLNGVGVFAPDDTMTRAEFLTVVARILYTEEEMQAAVAESKVDKYWAQHDVGPNGEIIPHKKDEIAPDNVWWSKYYITLVINDVIGRYKIEEMDQPMTREEMSGVILSTLEEKGERLASIKAEVQFAIPDFDLIEVGRRTSVVRAYQSGILCGVDAKGTFNPKGSLSRAEATKVLYRVIEPSTREKMDFSNIVVPPKPDPSIPAVVSGALIPWDIVDSSSTEPITIYEGQLRSNRPAKEGDIFVKKDGTQVVVKKDANGLVGGGQGLELDSGLHYNGWTAAEADMDVPFYYGGSNFEWRDSYENRIFGYTYNKNLTTGERHWYLEWMNLTFKYPRPTHEGVPGETSSEGYHLYRWCDFDGLGNWAWLLNIE